MKKNIPAAVTILIFMLTILATGCGTGAPGGEESGKEDSVKTGTLRFTANGEDFIRQGFKSKDGWHLTFDHAYITLAAITGHQTFPPYDPGSGGSIIPQTSVTLEGIRTVDLAEGDEEARPIQVGEVNTAPPGHYNAISWTMTNAQQGSASGYTMVIMGTAEKDGQIINFTLKDENRYNCSGGEYIGEQRKGIVEADMPAELEMTFHFDHVFGDAGAGAAEDLNTGALGFQPFADLADQDVLDADMAFLKDKMTPEDFQKLQEALLSLGHVGEGHCHCEVIGGNE